MTRCYFCKGTIQPKKIRHVHQWGEQVYIFDDVPADVCTQCGEVYFAPDVLDMMDRIAMNRTKPQHTIAVPVFSLA